MTYAVRREPPHALGQSELASALRRYGARGSLRVGWPFLECRGHTIAAAAFIPWRGVPGHRASDTNASVRLSNYGLLRNEAHIATPVAYTSLDVEHPVQLSTSIKGYEMAILGYARVSTVEQTLDLQRDAFYAAGVESVYEETASGKSTERPELAHCLKALREGDILVVWRLDRLGRNLKDLVQIVTDLETRGVKFKSLTESIDTSGPTGTLVFHMFAALAQFERELLQERTLAGLAAARARGRKVSVFTRVDGPVFT